MSEESAEVGYEGGEGGPDATADPTHDDMAMQTDVTGGLSGSRSTGPATTIIESRHLDVWYDDDQALDDVNLAIPENRVTATSGRRAVGSRRSSGRSTG
jgi:phosphate transport system ATP-binding protein